MKAREKVMITTITGAIESSISPASEQPKNVIKAVEKSARKLAHKLIRTQRQEKGR
jgi:hypothetical protein